ncbi:hypothetical protein Tco_1428284, partial [Tanacetum coccineum]
NGKIVDSNQHMTYTDKELDRNRRDYGPTPTSLKIMSLEAKDGVTDST